MSCLLLHHSTLFPQAQVRLEWQNFDPWRLPMISAERVPYRQLQLLCPWFRYPVLDLRLPVKRGSSRPHRLS